MPRSHARQQLYYIFLLRCMKNRSMMIVFTLSSLARTRTVYRPAPARPAQAAPASRRPARARRRAAGRTSGSSASAASAEKARAARRLSRSQRPRRRWGPAQASRLVGSAGRLWLQLSFTPVNNRATHVVGMRSGHQGCRLPRRRRLSRRRRRRRRAARSAAWRRPVARPVNSRASSPVRQSRPEGDILSLSSGSSPACFRLVLPRSGNVTMPPDIVPPPAPPP
jgi:hypothetical protein